MIQIIATLLLIALLVYGIVKQYNTVTLLFVLGLAALGVYIPWLRGKLLWKARAAADLLICLSR